MLNRKMEEALNRQLNAELYSSYLYLSMSAYFHSRNLPGFANWMRVQTQEELAHAMKFYDYVCGRGGRVSLWQIDGPRTEWESPKAAFENVFEHEQKVTGLINDLMNLAIGEKDHATSTFLQWFISEQVEEEASASDVLEKVKLVGESPNALLMLDRELAQRVFTPPASGKEGAK
jgi:ferritin